MAISLAVAFIGSVAAAVGTGMLTARSFRAPRADVMAITLAMLGLTVALGALTLGNLAGFGPATFRAMELSGQVVAPLALCLGMAEMAAQTIPVRFAARLILSALAVVEFVILSADQLNPAVAFSKSWPAASVYYETIPNDLLKFGIAPVTALTALITIGVAAVRLVRHPAWQPAAVATGSAAMAALALAVPAAVTLPRGAVFAAACLAAAGLAWFAGTRAGWLQRDLLNGSFADQDDDRWDAEESWDGHIDQTGDFDAVVTGGEGVYRGNGLYRPEAGGSASAYRRHDDDYDYERDGRDVGYLGDGYGREEVDEAYDGEYAGGYESGHADENYAANGGGRAVPDPRYEEYADNAEALGASDNGADDGARSRIWRSADRPGEPDHLAAASALAGDDEARARLFGQIAIYTLLEDRVDEFDLLTERVVEQVRAREPDTLVYILHAVPSAPMQRILYEVYRDRAAYDEHRRQSYVARFELERRPYVLATNVIELGLQQAKVSLLPSISDLLGPSGPGSPDFIPPAPGGQIPPAPGRQPGSGQAGHHQPGADPAWYGQPRHELTGHDQPGNVLAGYHEPGYHEPGHGEPGYDEPGYSEPGHGEPGYDEPGYSEPGYDEPGYDEPGHSEPGYDEPGHSEPGYAPPGFSPSGADEPPYAEPGYAEPRYAEPGYSPSGYSLPGSHELGHDELRHDEPRHDQPGYDELGYDQPSYDQPGYDQPGYDQLQHDQPGHDEAPRAEPRYGEPGYGQPGYDRPQPGGPADREEGTQRQW